MRLLNSTDLALRVLMRLSAASDAHMSTIRTVMINGERS
jgi:hypothetical protein